MFKKILFTFSSRLFTTVINFLIILVTARYLGADGRGIISLLVLGITINLLASNVFGGAAISYLAPRNELFRLAAPAYAWSLLSTLLLSIVLVSIDLIPAAYGIHLFFLSLLQSFLTIHLNLLLGRGHIKASNLVGAWQVAVLLVLLLFLLFIMNQRTAMVYVFSLYISLFFALLLSVFYLKNEIRFFPIKEWMGLWKIILKNGYVIQVASIAQLLNYRLSFYILDHYPPEGWEGKKLVGIYSTTVAMAEALWLIGRSMGLIQYTRIISETGHEDGRSLTVSYGKISLLLTTLMLIPFLLLPGEFYGYIFGEPFHVMPSVLLYLVPGILSFSMALMYSNYFAGKGMNKTNLTGSLTGLSVTLCAGVFLVPAMGMTGAAITASISYLATSFYLWDRFSRQTATRLADLLPGKKDFVLIKRELKNYLLKQR